MVYAIAQLKIHDRETYGRYQARFLPVLKQYEGRLLAADENPRVVEGEWSGDKVVVLGFADEAAFRRFSESAEYQEIAKDRKAGSSAVVLVVSGIG